MNVHKQSLLSIFDAKQRLEVPLFQRQYIWNRDEQWAPLWEDIQRKFSEALEGHSNAPVHFLGAMVLDQKQTPTSHVVVRLVIDGQQRLTTLQLFLAAFRDYCSSQACPDLAAETHKFIENTGMMAHPEVDRFKVWPTQSDRAQFRDVIEAGSAAELTKRHPIVRRKYARYPEPRARMVEAYFFFKASLEQFFEGIGDDPPIADEHPVAVRLEECFQTLRSALMVVVIDLDQGDDPQVIFETLNARGAPLLPADLLRNDIFFRAAREGVDVEQAYDKHWADFDNEFWREEVRQGRLKRPRSDLFLQHYLASRQGRDIPVKHLYVEYRNWITTEKPFHSVRDEMAAISRQAQHFRRIIAPIDGDPIHRLSTFLDAFEVRTAYPLLLTLLDANMDEDEWGGVTNALESFLLRRAVCNMETRNYNRLFLSLARRLRREGTSAKNLRQLLISQTGTTSVWPTDSEFRRGWLNERAYRRLTPAQVRFIMVNLNQTFMSSKAEALNFETTPAIEHLMPQAWEPHWPLPDGTMWEEPAIEDDDDGRWNMVQNREKLIQTLGNLTLLSTSLNAAQSNLPWAQKREALKNYSLLPINQNVVETEMWTEEAIIQRGNMLFERAVAMWSRAQPLL